MSKQERKEKLDLEKALKQQELDAKLQTQKKNDGKGWFLKKEMNQRKKINKKELEAKMALEQAKLEKLGSSAPLHILKKK